MGRPKAQSIRVLPVRDISKNPSVAKHKARKNAAKRKNWLVVWHVEGRQLQKVFRYKQEADTFMTTWSGRSCRKRPSTPRLDRRIPGISRTRHSPTSPAST